VWVGYDSRQSLGEKETGAKAALPIWITFMKAAIAGKDEEKFLSDTEDDRTLKAASEAPGMPANVHPALAVPAGARTVKASTALRPAVVAPAGISEEDLPAKPALKKQANPVTGTLPPKSQIKPALAPKAAPGKPAVQPSSAPH
jgi:penicillin-binding protein 1A